MLAFLERLLSSGPIDFLCKYGTYFCRVTWTLCVSIYVLVGSLHGICHLYHFDLKLSSILLFNTCPPLEMFSDLHLIIKYAADPLLHWWPMDAYIGELWGGGCYACLWAHPLLQRPVCLFYGALCLSTEPLWLCVSSRSCIMWLCCVVLGHAFKLQDFWVLIANWTGKIAWIISRETVEGMTFLLFLGAEPRFL